MRSILIVSILLLSIPAHAEPNCDGVNPVHYLSCKIYVAAIRDRVAKDTKLDKNGLQSCPQDVADRIVKDYETDLNACKEKNIASRIFLQGGCIEKATKRAGRRLNQECTAAQPQKK